MYNILVNTCEKTGDTAIEHIQKISHITAAAFPSKHSQRTINPAYGARYNAMMKDHILEEH